MQIIEPRANGYYRDSFENPGSNFVTGKEWVFLSWSDAITDQAERRAAELTGWTPTSSINGLSSVPVIKNEQDREKYEWYRRKAEEHKDYMESRLGTPRTEEEVELAVRNHGALADGRALEL